MNENLNTKSRILVAFASLAFISMYFFPAWRIDLFAPQYPEGLKMFIWINNFTGDVEIINGLNHYIGMKRITVDMFPEFKYMSYVVALYILFGLIVAISGKRKLLFSFVILILIGGLLVFYDLYKWGYEYGHNLDPTAPIQVPGFSYQPPVLGHKRLLNFDAYSFPDISGWIVFGSGLLLAGIWFYEWKINRIKKVNISPVLSFLFIPLFLSSCSYDPTPFVSGSDDCYVCKMGLADFRYGGELITKKGKTFKFDDLGCMIEYLESGSIEKKDIARILVINFERPNHFIDAEKAWIVVSPELKSPMKSNAAGFETKEEAEIISKQKNGTLLNWSDLIKNLTHS